MFDLQLTAECTAVDLSSFDVVRCMIVVAAAPFLWNVFARLIHRYLPADIGMDTRYIVCYTLFLWIFSFSTFRNILFHQLINDHPHCDAPEWWRLFWFVVSWGGMLMATYTHWVLGPTGVCMGDYCGILMEERVTGFPYTITDDPMYVFTSIYFLASAIADLSATGLLIALEVSFCYYLTCKVEGPYTTAIYANRERERAAVKPVSEDEMAAAKTVTEGEGAADATLKQRKVNPSTAQ